MAMASWAFGWVEVFWVIGLTVVFVFLLSMWWMVAGYVRYFGWRRVFPTFARLASRHTK